MADLKGAILIITHSRASLLDELFNCLESQINASDTAIIVVRQLGNKDVGDIVNKWRNKINIYIETDGSAKTTANNIARNRFAGYSVGFDALNADWILAVEDDVLLARDTISFTKFITRKYIHRKDFRAINLGSKLKKTKLSLDTYSLTRYGLFGPASVLTKSTWNKMHKWGIIQNFTQEHWDAAIEAFIKTGLTVAPNNSRYIDRGWGGTHTSDNPEDGYFSDLNESYIGNEFLGAETYKHIEMGYYWRKDLRKFKTIESPIYWANFLIRHPKVIFLINKIRFNRIS